MKHTHLVLAAAGLLLLVHLSAKAQAPFFGNSGIFDPEISVVNSGVVFDTQAVVSADRKYVTMTGRVSQAQLLSLQEFRFQTGNGVPGGQVGGGAVGGAVGAAGVANGAATGQEAPTTGARTMTGRTDRSSRQNSLSGNYADVGRPYPAPGRPVTERKPILEQEGMTLIGRVPPQ
jgi:hypothetical protein